MHNSSRGITKKRKHHDNGLDGRGRSKNLRQDQQFNDGLGDSFNGKSSSDDARQKSGYKKKHTGLSKTSHLGTCNMDDISDGTYKPILLPMNAKAESLFSAYERAEDGELIDMDNVPCPDATGVYASRDKAGTFCFACSHVGENTPAVADTEIAKLIENMYTLLLTTEIGRLSIIISQQYEERIRKKCNKFLKPGEVGLPPWSPRMVKEHIESHHNDPTFVILLTMCKMKELTRVLFDKCLVKKKVKKIKKQKKSITNTTSTPLGQEDNDDIQNEGYHYPIDRRLFEMRDDNNNNEEDENNEELIPQEVNPRDDNDEDEERQVHDNSFEDEDTQEGHAYDMEDDTGEEEEEEIVACPAVWKMIKESSETYIKLARSCPEKMAFFKEDRYLTKGGNVGHPFFNTNAKIYPASIRKNPSATTTNSSSSSKPQTVNLST